MRIDNQEHVKEIRSAFATSFALYRDAIPALNRVERTNIGLAQMKKPDEHDFLRQRDATEDPQAELAENLQGLRGALGYLDRAEELLHQHRATIQRLLE